jgi:PAS domain S-box-containing protein
MNTPATEQQRDQSPSAAESHLEQNGDVFASLFERSADAIWLYDPETDLLTDCNRAALELIGASSKEGLLPTKPENVSAPIQPGGLNPRAKTREIVAIVEKSNAHRFEWLIRRLDGCEVPVEVTSTAVELAGKPTYIVISRDITERIVAERALVELNQSLERRITDRTAALATSEARFRALVENAPEAIVVFDGVTGRFLFGNEHACQLYGVPMEKLETLTPADVSPEYQPNGRPSREAAREKMEEALAGKMPVFEWIHRRPNGSLIPTEVRLLRLPAEGQNLIRASIIDNTERKRAERALRESEAKFRTLFEATSNGVVLMDEDKLLEVNPAAVRMLGRRSADEMVGKHPSAFSPSLQPNGANSLAMAQHYIAECIAKGSLRFEWMCSSPQDVEIPLEVLLTRIEWSGRQVIQACITDITERKQAERALRESEAKFRALFEGSSQGVVLHDEDKLLEVNPAAVKILGRQSPAEIIGKDPRFMAPPFQPNGERSDAVGTRYIDECMANGSARFDWLASDPQGKHIFLEVALTRIQWSGRHVIQAFITDITERKEAERALQNANDELHREIEQRTRAEKLLQDRVRISTLNADIAVALNTGSEPGAMLQHCAELVVQHLDVAFARIWTLNEPTQILELQASAGYYTHLDGAHSRVKVGQFKIGLIAQEKKPHLTNNVQSDPRVNDQSWAAREGMISFAGYPLLIENRMLGVLAVFARRHLSDDVLKTLGAIADSIALGIERKRAQIALSESEARFSAAFQASAVCMSISRMDDGKYVLANDAFLQWTSYSLDDVVGRTSLELGLWADPADRDSFRQELSRTGAIHEREYLSRNRHGQVFTMLVSCDVIEIAGVAHLLTVGLDITQRKQAEAEVRASEARLRESEARFSAAFQASPALVGILRLSDTKYVLVNDAHVNWLGYAREEILGHTCLELGMWENPSEREVLLKEIQATGSIRQRECRWRNRKGEHFTVLLSTENIQINDTPHVLVMALDITQRKRAELEMLKALAREKELGQLKSNFVSMVSHEFRTPLGIIQSSAELLRDFFAKMDGTERQEQLQSIARNTRRMATMMEEILVLSRLDAGGLDFEPATFDPGAFCRRIVDEVTSATNGRCTIELQLDSLPAEAKGDESLLTHIFTNLLSNAVKYSEAGSFVFFSMRREADEAICVISDQGIGIPENEQERLFTAFQRGSNVGARPGTGLGLLLVKRCVELHKGTVTLASQAGQGTIATVRIPLFGGLEVQPN